MAIPLKYTFTFGDGTSHDASVTEISASLAFCFDYGWLIVPKSSGLDAAPTYTIEVSDDNVVWNPYDDVVADAAIDQSFDDTHLIPTYMRINYDADTNTTGNVSFDITLKK